MLWKLFAKLLRRIVTKIALRSYITAQFPYRDPYADNTKNFDVDGFVDRFVLFIQADALDGKLDRLQALDDRLKQGTI